MRALGVDLGTRRIGLAISDATGTLASPYEVVERSGDAGRDRAAIARAAQDTEAEVVVVGLPLSMDGRERDAARAARAEVEALRELLPVPVEVTDERLTTVTAHRALQEQGLRSKKRRGVVDKAAAAVLLQSWLDGRRS